MTTLPGSLHPELAIWLLNSSHPLSSLSISTQWRPNVFFDVLRSGWNSLNREEEEAVSTIGASLVHWPPSKRSLRHQYHKSTLGAYLLSFTWPISRLRHQQQCIPSNQAAQLRLHAPTLNTFYLERQSVKTLEHSRYHVIMETPIVGWLWMEFLDTLLLA